MCTKDQIEKYIELKAIKRISDYKKIAEYEKSSEQAARNKYEKFGKLQRFYAETIGVEFDDIKKLDEVTDEDRKKIDKLFNNQFTRERKSGFTTFENFYSWYKRQNNTCYYCGTTFDTLNQLFSNKKIKSTKFNSTLHIEQLNPKEGYKKENCVLACSLCNNAKSDLISKDNYKKYFAEAMKTFLSDLSLSEIENNTY